jgi:hypothetical protein
MTSIFEKIESQTSLVGAGVGPYRELLAFFHLNQGPRGLTVDEDSFSGIPIRIDPSFRKLKLVVFGR